MSAELWVLGMPLDEAETPSPVAQLRLREAEVIVAETRKVAMRYLKELGRQAEKTIFFLDPYRKEEIAEMKQALRDLARREGKAALFSDVGMPILFDPGAEVLALCRELGFLIRSVVGPTSWGAACSLSGFSPPFSIVGFLPRETEDRLRALRSLKAADAHAVLMDTPYRFRLLLKQAKEVLGAHHEAFLAWEIAKSQERLLWGSLSDLERQAQRWGLEKGEFVLVLRKAIKSR